MSLKLIYKKRVCARELNTNIPCYLLPLYGFGIGVASSKCVFRQQVLCLFSTVFNPFGHGRFSRRITNIENGIKRFLYIHIAYP